MRKATLIEEILSNHFYLHCEVTNEAVETVAEVGGKDGPRIDPNALGAFLAYHRAMGQYDFRLRNADDFDDEHWPTIWDQGSYRELVGREPRVSAVVLNMESQWVWIRRDSQP